MEQRINAAGDSDQSQEDDQKRVSCAGGNDSRGEGNCVGVKRRIGVSACRRVGVSA
jgi:hypothetical protein